MMEGKRVGAPSGKRYVASRVSANDMNDRVHWGVWDNLCEQIFCLTGRDDGEDGEVSKEDAHDIATVMNMLNKHKNDLYYSGSKGEYLRIRDMHPTHVERAAAKHKRRCLQFMAEFNAEREDG